MTFNDEGLARAVAACPVPVITGIGHEPDTCICDMVADRRCSTPTAAAESVAPAIDELAQKTNDRHARLATAMSRIVGDASLLVGSLGERASRAMEADLARRRIALDALATRRCLTDPHVLLDDRLASLELTEERLHAALPRTLALRRSDVEATARRLESASGRLLQPYDAFVARTAATLDALSPLKVLGRGYAIARDEQGHVVSQASQVSPGDTLSVLLGAGEVVTSVTTVKNPA